MASGLCRVQVPVLTKCMARELGLHVVAEGVETEAQRQALSRHPVDLLQGYLTGRPVSAAEFERQWLRTAAPGPV